MHGQNGTRMTYRYEAPCGLLASSLLSCGQLRTFGYCVGAGVGEGKHRCMIAAVHLTLTLTDKLCRLSVVILLASRSLDRALEQVLCEQC